jgi:hypothetical protein
MCNRGQIVGKMWAPLLRVASVVESHAEIVPGFVTHHVWHPDPNVEEPTSHRGHRLSDPGIPSPRIYEVSTDPATQDIHIRVVRTQ